MPTSLTASLGGVLVGIDVGGTKVRTLVSDGSGRVHHSETEATEPDVLAQVSRIVGSLGPGSVRGLGVGVPGVVHPETGVVHHVPNVPTLEGRSLADELTRSLSLPVVVENDLAAAALAEHTFGRHQGKDLAVIAAGTGIGLGVVHLGVPVRGGSGAAGEIAELPLPDGRRLEDAVSSSGLLADYRRHGGDAGHGVRDVLRAALSGKPAALRALDTYAEHLAHATHVICVVLDPAHVVLTGGIGARTLVLSRLVDRLPSDVARRVVRSVLGSDSPAHGALVLAATAAERAVAGAHVED